MQTLVHIDWHMTTDEALRLLNLTAILRDTGALNSQDKDILHDFIIKLDSAIETATN